MDVLAYINDDEFDVEYLYSIIRMVVFAKTPPSPKSQPQNYSCMFFSDNCIPVEFRSFFTRSWIFNNIRSSLGCRDVI